MAGSTVIGLSSLQAALTAGCRQKGDYLRINLLADLGDGGYGPLRTAGPDLMLPAGFQYRMIGVEGILMSDGNPTPRDHDGTAAFALPNGNIRLVRNHEETTRATPDGAFIQCRSDEMVQLLRSNQPLQLGGMILTNNYFQGLRIGIHLQADGSLNIGVS